MINLHESNHLIIVFIIAAVIVIGINIVTEQIGSNVPAEFACNTADDCMPKEACHATSCVAQGFEENREGILCSQVCSGPLDCGAGECGCVQGRCQIIQ